MRLNVILFLFLLFGAQNCADTVPTYSILAPQIVRGTFDYNVIVALEGISTQTSITCTIERNKDGNKETNQQVLIFDSDNKFQVIRPQIGKSWTPGNYSLSLIAHGGIEFTENIPIKYEYKQFVILIQTNKAIYRPGDDVLLRVIVVDDQLFPVDKEKVSDLEIFILDAQGIKLSQLKMDDGNHHLGEINLFNYTDGVTDDIAFHLHENSAEGNWNIQVTTNEQVQNYTFFVASYMLPMVNITIGVPEYIKASEKILNYRIDVLYTFGKPVHGDISLKIKKISECKKSIEEDYVWETTASINKNGQIIGNLDFIDTKFIFNNCTEYTFNISVEAKDNITEIFYYEYETFDIIAHEFQAEFINTETIYRPGPDLTKTIKISGKNGKLPNQDELNKFVCMAKLRTTSEPNKYKDYYSEISYSKDEVHCVFKTFNDYLDMIIYIEDRDKEFIFNQQNITFKQNCINDYIQIKLQEQDVKLEVGGKYKFIAESSVEFDSLIYYIVVRGSIITTKSISFGNGPAKVQQFLIDIKRQMVPEAIIAVFIQTKNTNYILSDSVKITTKGMFYSDVTFDVKTPLLDAGEEAKIVIEAEEESRVFILGLDESVLALKQGNDVSEKRVLAELLNNPYILQTNPFQKSGMIFRCSAKSECPQNEQFFSSFVWDRQVDPCEFDNTCNVKPPEAKIRKNFRETWIWDEVTLSKSKRTGLISNVPDSFTTWKVTGFSINKKSGLGLTSNPGYVKVFRDFFIKLNLPYSIQREEITEINMVVFNYHNDTLNIKMNVYENSTQKNYIKFKDCNQNFELKAQDIKSFNCFIECERVGKYDIIAEVFAENQNKQKFSDGELKELLVVYEGIPQERTQSIFFDLTQINSGKNHLEEIKEIKFPDNRVNGSESLMLGGTIELVKVNWQDNVSQAEKRLSDIRYDFSEPLDCCQQRVIGYFPKVFWLNYMYATKRGTEDDYKRAKDAVQLTVNMLCYQNPFDGSFVYYERWGPAGEVISNEVVANQERSFMWQTAYALQLLKTAKRFVNVDLAKMKRTVDWLKSKEQGGEFIETNPDYTLFPTPTNAYLTAFVRISLNETGEFFKGIDQWLEVKYPFLTDKLEIFTSCYAFHLFNGKLKDRCYNDIMKIVISDSRGKLWLDNNNNKEDLHLTAYGLKILIERKEKNNAFSVFKYIMSCQDNSGNYHVTPRDNVKFTTYRTDSYITILCTEAMTKFVLYSQEMKQLDDNVFINFEADGKKLSELHLNTKRDFTQVLETNPDIKKLKISAQGYGHAKANIYLRYNVKDMIQGDFNVHVNGTRKNDKYISLDICNNNKNGHRKNSMIEIDLPSGVSYHSEDVKMNTTFIDRIEVKNGGTRLVIYVRKIDKEGFCFTIPAIESHKVFNMKPVPIKVYDHYDRSGMTIKTYNIQ